MVSAIVVAAGKGLRMNSEVPKQYMELAGRPVLHHSLGVMERCEAVDEILWVAPPIPHPLETRLADLLQNFGKPLLRVAGGATRQESVFLGLQAVNPHPEGHWIVVHDAVRPLVTVDQVARCIREARESGACVPGIPAYDTLKRVGPGGRIQATLSRSGVWLTQTPQVFRYDWLARAHETSRSEGRSGTDDASLLEYLGFPVRMIRGRRTNLKITSPEDLDMALAILQAGPGEAIGTH